MTKSALILVFMRAEAYLKKRCKKSGFFMKKLLPRGEKRNIIKSQIKDVHKEIQFICTNFIHSFYRRNLK